MEVDLHQLKCNKPESNRFVKVEDVVDVRK